MKRVHYGRMPHFAGLARSDHLPGAPHLPRLPYLVMQLMVLLMLSPAVCGGAISSQQEVLQALSYVEHVKNQACSSGGTSQVLMLQLNTSLWDRYADTAVKTANLMNKLVVLGNGSLAHLDESFFYMLVRNNVGAKGIIFGSALGMEPYVTSPYRLYCPYAFHKNRTVHAFDLGINYDYQTNGTEWYHKPRTRVRNLIVHRDQVKYRYNNTHFDSETVLQELVVDVQDGDWTYPYFDCGGGDIWMVTYSAPIIYKNPKTPSMEFLGVATIDIELTNIDVNQCDADQDSAELDVFRGAFRGSHSCDTDTMQCGAVPGQGFVRGAYLCYCKEGYYFPNTTALVKGYRGIDIEASIAENGAIAAPYVCNRCSDSCETCIDATACPSESSTLVRAATLIAACLVLCASLI